MDKILFDLILVFAEYNVSADDAVGYLEKVRELIEHPEEIASALGVSPEFVIKNELAQT